MRTVPLTALRFVCHTKHRLTRNVAYRFTLCPNRAQEAAFRRAAGAARFAYNYHIGVVNNNLDLRSTQRLLGLSDAELAPSLSWSKLTRINAFNKHKNGLTLNSPRNTDGTVGLTWRASVPADVFECASVDAATARKNFSDSRRGKRAGVRVGFPKFKARNHTAASFRLRSKSKPGEVAPVRFTDAKHLLLPRLGAIKVHGSTRQLRRMITKGRFHVLSATVKCEGGRWHVAVAGVAAEFHHQHRRGSKPARSSTKATGTAPR